MASPSDPADAGLASEPFRVPDSVARGGGSVTGNPFPFDDPLHRKLERALISGRYPLRAATAAPRQQELT
jgi:hypothetical protein